MVTSTTINYSTGTNCIAIHPNGSHLYVAASGAPAGFIQVFSVDSAGVLTATSQVPSGHGSSCIAVDASGEFMYVTHNADNAVSTYGISPGGGTLTLIEQDPTGTFPVAVALTP